MRKIFFIIFALLLFSNLQAQNGWQSFTVPAPGGEIIHFGDANTGIILNPNTPNYLRTTNGGNNWQVLLKPDTSFQKLYNNLFFVNSMTGWIGGVYIFVPISGGFLYKTTDGGLSWGNQISVRSLNDIEFINETTGYIAMGDIPSVATEGSVAKSTNGGNNWTYLDIEVYTLFNGVSFINPQTGWVAGYYGDDVGINIEKIFYTSNGGSNFTKIFNDSTVNGTHDHIRKIKFFDQNTGYLLRTKLFKTSDGGINWQLLDTSAISGNYIRDIFFLNKDTGWITTGPTGWIYRTNNGGGNWISQNTGQSNIYGQIYFHDVHTGWVMANTTTLLKTTTGGITAISNISSEIPGNFSLRQNYPNPFNPSTSIRFDIPRQGFVSLKVFDISGREMAEPVKEDLQPGVYEYTFDGADLGSGVYFYRLTTNNFSETKRMVLVK